MTPGPSCRPTVGWMPALPMPERCCRLLSGYLRSCPHFPEMPIWRLRLRRNRASVDCWTRRPDLLRWMLPMDCRQNCAPALHSRWNRRTMSYRSRPPGPSSSRLGTTCQEQTPDRKPTCRSRRAVMLRHCWPDSAVCRSTACWTEGRMPCSNSQAGYKSRPLYRPVEPNWLTTMKRTLCPKTARTGLPLGSSSVRVLDCWTQGYTLKLRETRSKTLRESPHC